MAFLEARDGRDRIGEWVDRNAGKVFILPAVLTLLAFSLFPLLISAYLTLTKLKFSSEGFLLKFVKWLNFKKLIFGSQQYHLLGTFDPLGAIDWLVIGAIFAPLLYFYVRYLIRPGATVVGVIGRSVATLVAGALTILLVLTLGGGFPGSLVVTLFYVFVGVSVQFGLALGLAVLCSQNIYGRNLFRVVFFLPIMVTPVGIAYMFRMLADMHKGPFARHLDRARAQRIRLGVGPVDGAHGGAHRRYLAVDAVHVHRPARGHREPAARSTRSRAHRRRRRGGSHSATSRGPAIAPVAATIVLIRLIEAFKIIDLPNVLTNGGPRNRHRIPHPPCLHRLAHAGTSAALQRWGTCCCSWRR